MSFLRRLAAALAFMRTLNFDYEETGLLYNFAKDVVALRHNGLRRAGGRFYL